MEVIERKGNGHPDTIADNLAEALGNRLRYLYKVIYGEVKHYNVDKVLVSCGKINYKKRKMIKSVKIVFSGNMTKIIGIKSVLEEIVKKVLNKEIKRGLKYKIYNHIAECSPDLTNNFSTGKCNDTSFAVGFPLSKAEKKVLKISNDLETLSNLCKGIGTDHKVMYINNKIFIAIALIGKDRDEYEKIKKKLYDELSLSYNNFEINTGDNEVSCFNTVTGTSLEQGDAGMTGRGNRRNGLITPLKPMTMEAYCGKNDVTHIGRIYQDLAQEIADKDKKKVLLVNNIGNDIEDYKKIIIK